MISAPLTSASIFTSPNSPPPPVLLLLPTLPHQHDRMSTNSHCVAHGLVQMPAHDPSMTSCAWNPNRKCKTKASHSSSHACASRPARRMAYHTYGSRRVLTHACVCSGFGGSWNPSRASILGGLCCSCNPRRSSNMAASELRRPVLSLSETPGPSGILNRAPTYASAECK